MTSPVGARIRRVDRPLAELLTLELAAGDRLVLLLCVAASVPRAGIVLDRPRGKPIDAFGSLLRRTLEGGTILALEVEPRGARLVVEGPEGQVVLEAIGDREGRGFRLLDHELRLLHGSTRTLRPLGDTAPVDDDRLHAAGTEILEALRAEAIEARRRAHLRSLARALGRLRRSIAAVEGDAARADDVALLRHEADLLIALPPDERRGRETLVVLDWACDPATERAIPIDPRRSPREEAAHRYRRARKLERGVTIALERRAKLLAELARLEQLEERAERASGAAELDALDHALEELRVRPAAERGVAEAETPRSPFRQFASERGIPIWVGRGAKDNDTLSVRLARPHHLFLHVRGRTGAHVIVPLGKGTICDEATLADAATLAAHFSDARGESTVEVIHAERRYVRKPRGAAPGAVRLDREKTFLLRFEPQRLARLLASETLPGSKRKRPRGS